MTKYTYSQLEDLWMQAGGSATAAAMAAAIALAESGGDSNSTHTNSNGTIDRGLWQINSIHGSQSTLDPLSNARAAVAISSNGNTWRPWCTAWSNGNCSGQYLGSGSPYQKFLMSSPTGSGGGTGTTPASVTADMQTAGNPLSGLDPQAWAKAFLVPLASWAFYGAMLVGGFVIFFAGGMALLWDTPVVQTLKRIGEGALSFGAVGRN